MNIGSSISFGWETFWKRPGLFIAAELLMIGAYIGGTIVSAILEAVFSSVGLNVLGTISNFVMSYGVSFGVTIAAYSFFLKSVDSVETVQLSDMNNFRYYWQFVGTTVLYIIVVFVGFLLFIVPGVILSVAFFFAPVLVLDRGLGPIEALKESARITKGRRIKIFVFSLAFMAVMVGGFLSLLIGLFVAYPVARLAMMYIYRRTVTLAAENAPHEKLSKGEKWFVVAWVIGYAVFVALVMTAVIGAASLIARQSRYGSQNFYPNEPGFVVHREESPASSLAPLNAVRLPFTSFSLTNNTSAEVVVQSVSVDVSDLPNPRGISGIEIIEYNGLQAGKTVVPKSDGSAVVDGPFIVPAGVTRAFTVTANIADCDMACPDKEREVHIDLTGITSASMPIGELPITGAVHVMNPNLKLGAVTVSKDSVSSSRISLETPSDLLTMHFNSDGGEVLKLYVLRFKYEGAIDPSSFSGLFVSADGEKYPAVWSDDKKYLDVAIDNGIEMSGTGPLSVSLKGTVAQAIGGDMIRFDIESPSHIYFVGQTYGYGVMPKIPSNSVGVPWIRGDAITVN